MARILVADDQEMMRDSLAATLARDGHEVIAAGDGPSAVSRLSAGGRFDLLITDLKMPKMTGIELLAEAKRLRPDMPVVLMTAFATVATAVEAMKLGAYDYIQKPFDGEEIKLLVDRTLEHNRLIRENQALRTMTEMNAPRPLIGDSEIMLDVKKRIDLVAQSSATVIIRGESGTGKEVVARAIHAASPRKDRPMLAVNCAALSENLLESELFGHEKGAFTGADRLRRGRFELADGGSLLLDEISEIAPSLQAKLLRVLQENTFERVGSSMSQQVDVRVIATTNRDLEKAVEDGKFRQDLFYRLHVVPIELPPLRQRIEDIPEYAGLSPADRARVGALGAPLRAASATADLIDRVVHVRHDVEAVEDDLGLGLREQEAHHPNERLPHIHSDRLDAGQFVERKARQATHDALAGPLGSHVDDVGELVPGPPGAGDARGPVV